MSKKKKAASPSMKIAKSAEKMFGAAVRSSGPVFVDQDGKKEHLPPLDPNNPLALACKSALEITREADDDWEVFFEKYGKTDANGVRCVLTYDADIPKILEKAIKEQMAQDAAALPEAIRVLASSLLMDPGYRMTWQANIAMAFKDEWYRYRKRTGRKNMNMADIHVIANDAAENFLQLLCTSKKTARRP